MTSKHLILPTVATLALAVAACGGTTAAPTSAPASPSGAAPASSPAAKPSAAVSAPASAAAKPAASAPASAAAKPAGSAAAPASGVVPLTLYAATGYDDAMGKAFTAQTGIPVNLVADSTGPLMAKIQAEKSNPQWSLVWVDGAEPIAGLDQQGMLLQGWEPNVQWTDQGKSLLPKNQSYIPDGVTVTGAVVYDSSKVTTPPTSWQDMVKPDWKNAVGMNNPSISGPTYPFVAGLMDQLGGEDPGKAFFKQLKSNGLRVYPKNKDTLHGADVGEIKLSMIQSSAGYAANAQNPKITVSYLPKAVMLPNVMAIDGKASPQVIAEAKQFVEFELSANGQKVATTAALDGDSLFWPLVQGVSPAKGLPELSTIPTNVVDPYVWGAKQDEINQWFTDNIVP